MSPDHDTIGQKSGSRVTFIVDFIYAGSHMDIRAPNRLVVDARHMTQTNSIDHSGWINDSLNSS